jgi:hypothetical protein
LAVISGGGRLIFGPGPHGVFVDAGTAKVLLVGKSEGSFWSLLPCLRTSGWQCEVVTSCLEGVRLLAQGSFDVILCSVETSGAQWLIAMILGSSVSLFRYLPVENGCWWIPTVLRGKRCMGALALRPNEFAKALETLALSPEKNLPQAA